MRKLRVKLLNAIFYPPMRSNKKFKKIKKGTPPASEMIDLLRRWNLKDIDDKNQNIFNQGSYKLEFSLKLVDALLFQENGLAITLTSQYEL